MSNQISTKKKGKQTIQMAEQTRQAIIEAGLKVFAEKGFEASGLRDIAVEAGVTHGLIRHYFGTKEAVWKVSVDFAINRLSVTYIPYANPEKLAQYNSVELLKQAIRDFLGVSAKYPEIIRLVMHEGVRGGERLNYILSKYDPEGAVMEPLFQAIRKLGYLRQFEGPTFFLFLLTAGAIPLALPALSNWAIRANINNEVAINHHIERIVQTLFVAGN